MRDFSVQIRNPGTMGPASSVEVLVDNHGMERTFESVIRLDGHYSDTSPSCKIGRMQRGVITLRIPELISTGPKDVTATVITTADGLEPSEVNVRFKYLPAGWFDRLQPYLNTAIGRYAIESCGSESKFGPLMTDIADAYGSLIELRPRPEETGRYLHIADPDSVMDFGDCTESEAAVAYMSQLLSKGRVCSIVRMGSSMYIGVSTEVPDETRPVRYEDGSGYIFTRPFDACCGTCLSASMDLSFSRLRGILPAERVAGTDVASGISKQRV